MSTPTHPGVHEPTAAEFIAVQRSHEFEELRHTQRQFTFPLSVAFFSWYVVYVLLATFLPDWMGTPAFGGMNIGVVLGLAQFVTSFIITWAYVKYANKNIEPKAAKIREEMEG